MAKVTFSKPHLLLLDEPSNHLDMDAVEALVEVSDGRTQWGSLQLDSPRHQFCTANTALHPATSQATSSSNPAPGPLRRAWRCSRAACSWCRTTST